MREREHQISFQPEPDRVLIIAPKDKTVESTTKRLVRNEGNVMYYEKTSNTLLNSSQDQKEWWL